MWNSLVALAVALFLVDTCSAQNYLQVYPVGCGYDVVQQNIKLCYIDYYYSAGFEFLGYQYPDAMICSYPSYSFYESEYSEMQTDAFSYTVNSEQDTSLDLQLHGANWMLGFGFENTYSYAYSLLGGDISYFATSNQIYPHYGCRLQSSYEEGIKYLAQLLAGMPDDCTASEDMDQYISLVETTGTHYVIQANFGQSVNFTVSVQKAAMASLSYSEQEEIINAGILNVEADQGIGLSSAQNDTASQWNAYYSSMSYNITVYRGGIYTGDFNSWLASGSDYANNVWLPFCVSMIPMDEMVPFYVPEPKRMCFSNAVVMYWQSFGSSGQATMKPKC